MFQNKIRCFMSFFHQFFIDTLPYIVLFLGSFVYNEYWGHHGVSSNPGMYILFISLWNMKEKNQRLKHTFLLNLSLKYCLTLYCAWRHSIWDGYWGQHRTTLNADRHNLFISFWALKKEQLKLILNICPCQIFH